MSSAVDERTGGILFIGIDEDKLSASVASNLQIVTTGHLHQAEYSLNFVEINRTVMEVELTTVGQDIVLMYETASSFPEGVSQAFDRLYRRLQTHNSRDFYGISRPEQGLDIIYRAGVEPLDDREADILDLPCLILPAGAYYTLSVKDFRKNPAVTLSEAFRQLLRIPDIDPQGFCVEVYTDRQPDLVTCMVRRAL